MYAVEMCKYKCFSFHLHTYIHTYIQGMYSEWMIRTCRYNCIFFYFPLPHPKQLFFSGLYHKVFKGVIKKTSNSCLLILGKNVISNLLNVITYCKLDDQANLSLNTVKISFLVKLSVAFTHTPKHVKFRLPDFIIYFTFRPKKVLR